MFGTFSDKATAGEEVDESWQLWIQSANWMLKISGLKMGP